MKQKYNQTRIILHLQQNKMILLFLLYEIFESWIKNIYSYSKGKIEDTFLLIFSWYFASCSVIDRAVITYREFGGIQLGTCEKDN